MSQTLYSWNFSTTKDRGPMWYIIAFACVVGLAIWGFLAGQYGLSFIVLLVAGVVFFVENNSADEIHVILSDVGIRIGESFYEYNRIQSFGFLYEADQARVLRLKINRKTLPHLDVDVDNGQVSNIRNILSNYLTEDDKGEFSFSDKFIRVTKL